MRGLPENITMRWKLAVTTAFAIAGLGSVVLFFLGSDANKGFTSTCGLQTADIGRFAAVPGGGFIKGAHGVYPEEGTPVKLHVSPFQIQVHEVTNDQFAAFVRETGYVTEAEGGDGSAQFTETQTPADLYSWWRLDIGATWQTPAGEGSTLNSLGRHPVVHISLNDARAYADWAGGRIPNEIEWEYAASLGLFDPDDPDSGIAAPDGTPRANIWTGVFPVVNSEEDGFAGTAPVGCYEASLIGIYDMIGNVWEWTESRFSPSIPAFTIKGGSYLCGSNFCRRYRVAARESQEQDFSTAHIGFRIVKDLE